MFETWKCIVDPEARGLTAGWMQNGLPAEAREVTIPHTANVEEGLEEYRGPIWYSHEFTAAPEWKDRKVLLHFGGVYRDAVIWLNGRVVGEHYDSGFSPFTIDITEALHEEKNLLVVRVDNAFSLRALPIDRSFDWADDGGMIRGVRVETVKKDGIRRVQVVSAKPEIPSIGKRVRTADVHLRLRVCAPKDAGLQVDILDGETVISHFDHYTGEAVIVPALTLWHFDEPKLYTAAVILIKDGAPYDRYEVTFGARSFTTDGTRFVLNGEPVRLCGVEWMPGSNPAYGNAEPVAYLEKILAQLKESNCVFTRFHWQQDDAIYDWCDRHGMLVQEEIPNWGSAFGVDENQLEVSRRQAEEMVTAHGHHPSLVSWGVGNEMRGTEPETKAFLAAVRDIFRELDPDRLVNYISNSWWRDPKQDAVSLGDSMWINEYFGTWVQGRDVEQDLSALVEAHPDLPIVISEFGVCEPAFPGGDPARIENLVQKMKIYRAYPQIAGTIHFSLNDYRTQMGEEGEGKLRRRVHGSTDMYGQEKPSYKVLQKESAPITVEEGEGMLTITCRNDLPCHAVLGYLVTTEDGSVTLPDLQPGEAACIKWSGKPYRICRPNGDIVL